MSNICNLHQHTIYSALDGMAKIPELVKRAKELGMTALTISDHGTISGHIEFYRECQKQGIKPILASEFYFVENLQKAKDEKQRHAFHLVVLAENYTGWLNLCRLTTEANKNYYYKPRIDAELLKKHKEGLIVLTACLHGPIAYHLFDHVKTEINTDGQEVSTLKSATDIPKAYEFARTLKSIFGPNNFFLETQDATLPEQKICNPRIRKLAEDLGLKCVATQDAHYVQQSDAESHSLLKSIAFGQSSVEQAGGNGFGAPEFYLKSKEEWLNASSSLLDEELERTNEIADRCNVKLPLGQMRLPNITENHSASFLLLEEKALKSLESKGLSKEYIERLNKELRDIQDCNLSDYFLIVEDIVNWAKSNGISVGPARGSSAGSLVAYLLNITELDPIKYGLIWERFYNAGRKGSLPDIDVDIEKSRREEVVDYIKQKFGNNRVAQMVNFNTLGARAVLKDIFRVVGLDFDLSNRITSLVPAKNDDHAPPSLTEAIRASAELALYANNDQEFEIVKDGKVLRKTSYKRLFDVALKLEGCIRGIGKHAAAVIISDKDFSDAGIPLVKSAGDNYDLICGWDLDAIDKLGFLKMDILGLSTLSVIKTVLQLIHKRHGVQLNIKDIPLDDPKVFQLISDGETEGVFQLESSLGKTWSKRAKPNSLDEIAELLSILRPGCLDTGMSESYIQIKRGLQPITYLHPILEDVLKPTHGTLLYQEQVINLTNKVCKWDLKKCDTLRKVIGKKIPEELRTFKDEFIRDATVTVGPKIADQLWLWIEVQAGYLFNKSHAYSYGLISYQTAYLKANYPVEFFCGNLMHAKDKAGQFENSQDVIAAFINDAKLHGISIVPPSLKHNNIYFEIIDDDTIAFGFSSIKNVGAVACNKLKNLTFTSSLRELLLMTQKLKLNKQVIIALISCGVFDQLKLPRQLMLQQYKLLSELSEKEYEAWVKTDLEIDVFIKNLTLLPREELKTKLGMAPNKNRVLKLTELYNNYLNSSSQDTVAQILSWEEEYLGMSISGNLADFRDRNSNATCLDVAQSKCSQEDIRICVTLNEIKEIQVKKGKSSGKPMAFLRVSDSTYSLDNVVMFTDTYLKYKDLITPGDVLILKGKISDKGSLMINFLQRL